MGAGTEALPLFQQQAGQEEGGARKEEVLEAHEGKHQTLLQEVRSYLKKLYRLRVKRIPVGCPFVSANDARAYLADHHPDLEKGGGKRNWMGALFRGKEWEFTGIWIPSSEPLSNGSAVRCWRLVERGDS